MRPVVLCNLNDGMNEITAKKITLRTSIYWIKERSEIGKPPNTIYRRFISKSKTSLWMKIYVEGVTPAKEKSTCCHSFVEICMC